MEPACWSLPVPMEVAKELLEFVRHREAIQHGNAVAIQAKLRRERHGHAIRGSPVNGGAQVLRGQAKPEAIGIAQAAVHFDARLKLLRAKSAFLRPGGKLQRTARPQCIDELPGLAGTILFGNEPFADVATVSVAAQNQFEFHLALDMHARQPVRRQEIWQPIVTYRSEEHTSELQS